MNRTDIAIEAVADALLTLCALQTESEDPRLAYHRAIKAMATVAKRAAEEARGR